MEINTVTEKKLRGYRITSEDSAEVRLLKMVANRLNVEEHSNPGGVYLMAALRPDINECLVKLGHKAT